jgi:superfamily II DNA helicase RecQ
MVKRVFIDEIHDLVLSNSFRKEFRQLGFLTTANVSIVGMTATFPKDFYHSIY